MSLTLFAVLDPIPYWEESSISLAFSKISSVLLNSAVIPLWSTSLFREGLQVAISHLLHEYSSGCCTLHAVYLVKSWYNSLWRLIPKWPRKLFGISVSSETWKLRFHLVLETTLEHLRNWVSRIPRKLGIHPVPEWPRNPSEIWFPCFLGFLGNSETRETKSISILMSTRPLIYYS